METAAQRKLLESMVVLELTEFQAGATCTQTLAWMEAEVIKVEPPQTGEPSRRVGKPTDAAAGGVFFFLHNTSKKSTTLNLRHRQGQELFAQLVSKVDVVVNNLQQGNFERLGWSYERLQQVNPAIIYATISGFGAEGPYSEFPYTETIAQALGGGVCTTGYPDRPPTMPRNNAGESGAGLHTALAILAAYADRLDTGRSHQVEVSMLDAVVNLVRTKMWPYYNTGKSFVRRGNRLATVPGGLYPCKPGGPNDYVYVYVHYNIPTMWDGCLRAMERADLIGDERFADSCTHLEHRDEIEEMFTAWTMSKTKYEVLEALGREGVPCGATLDTSDMLTNEHLRAREMMVEIEHPEYGPMTLPGCPIKVSDGSITFTPAPLLGADNAAVYGKLLGFDGKRLQELQAQGVI